MADKVPTDGSQDEDTPPQSDAGSEEEPRLVEQVEHVQGRGSYAYIEVLALVALVVVVVCMSMSTPSPSALKNESPRSVESPFLDLAIAIDTTGSMGSYIESARENIGSIVDSIVYSQKMQVRLALVEYRDHPPQDSSFVTRSHGFTRDVTAMHRWLSQCRAEGGGDGPEAVADAMFELTQLGWHEDATKMAILVSDAPPHGLQQELGDAFPQGSPAGHDPIKVARRLGMMNVTLYVVGCEPSLSPYKELFNALAFLTGGQYLPLNSAKQLSKLIVGGAEEKVTLQPFIEEAQREVRRQFAERGHDLDVEEMAKQLHQRLKSQGATSKRIVYNDDELDVSEEAKDYARMDFNTLRTAFAASAKASGDGGMDAFEVEDSEVTYKQARRLVREAMTRDEL